MRLEKSGSEDDSEFEKKGFKLRLGIVETIQVQTVPNDPMVIKDHWKNIAKLLEANVDLVFKLFHNDKIVRRNIYIVLARERDKKAFLGFGEGIDINVGDYLRIELYEKVRIRNGKS